ncbi:HD domain-containing protein [Kutzneria sp. 744]|uniref:HD domain-containing protein n=1 Tax=Kutzneria sp. (strain 744) TaxID=345341 RepID=UPI0003EEC669|nr:HD domain-containing protein [Kutzneria sp. 744]EWM17601.1 metal-dependent phosphohydrolase [Kutzneria sp. 744]
MTTIQIPDTKIAREATELVRDQTTDLVYDHSRRVYHWASLQGRNRDLSWDPELLYVAAMFHDIGLGEAHHASGRRFEVDGAVAARDFLRGHDVAEDSVRRVWTAIALHTTPGIPEFMEPEIALLTAGVEYDCSLHRLPRHQPRAAGRGRGPAPPPRLFKRRILQSFTDGIAPKPDTTFGNVKADVLAHYVPGFRRGDFVETILNSDWPE